MAGPLCCLTGSYMAADYGTPSAECGVVHINWEWRDAIIGAKIEMTSTGGFNGSTLAARGQHNTLSQQHFRTIGRILHQLKSIICIINQLGSNRMGVVVLCWVALWWEDRSRAVSVSECRRCCRFGASIYMQKRLSTCTTWSMEGGALPEYKSARRWSFTMGKHDSPSAGSLFVNVIL